MDKTRLIVTETYRSASEADRRDNLQKAVDQYIRLQLVNGRLPEEDRSLSGVDPE